MAANQDVIVSMPEHQDVQSAEHYVEKNVDEDSGAAAGSGDNEKTGVTFVLERNSNSSSNYGGLGSLLSGPHTSNQIRTQGFGSYGSNRSAG